MWRRYCKVPANKPARALPRVGRFCLSNVATGSRWRFNPKDSPAATWPAKRVLDRRGKTRRYQAPAEGLQTMVAVGVLRDKVLKPVLARRWQQGRPPNNQSLIDKHYLNLRKEMRKLLMTLKIPA